METAQRMSIEKVKLDSTIVLNNETKKDLSLLRPEVTVQFLKHLTKPMSINLLGKKGNGQKRLFEDINKIKGDDTRAFYVNLKSYAENYDGLMRELSQQVLETPVINKKISDIFKNNTKQCILFIDNYDAILGNLDIDPKYDKDFIDDLCYIQRHNLVSLLCVTENAQNSHAIFIEKKVHRNSWFELECVDLDNLTHKEIENELLHQLKPEYCNWLNINTYIKQELIETIHKHNGENYKLLCYLANEINFQNSDDDRLKYDRRLQLWMKKYKKQNKESFVKRLYKAKRGIDIFMIILGIPKFSIGGFIAKIIFKIKGK